MNLICHAKYFLNKSLIWGTEITLVVFLILSLCTLRIIFSLFAAIIIGFIFVVFVSLFQLLLVIDDYYSDKINKKYEQEKAKYEWEKYHSLKNAK